MKANSTFLNKPKTFWAAVRSITQEYRAPRIDRTLIDVISKSQIQEYMTRNMLSNDLITASNEEERKEIKELTGERTKSLSTTDLLYGYFSTFLKPAKIILRQDEKLWRCIYDIVSSEAPHVDRNPVRPPKLRDLRRILSELNLNPDIVGSSSGDATELGRDLVDYMAYRAKVLTDSIRPKLMEFSEAKHRFYDMYKSELETTVLMPENKQKGTMRDKAFFTGMINILISKNKGNVQCDYDPRKLTTITQDGIPLRTLARRVDGALPGSVDPVAIWEIKEYYYTTTFGSRVADGVYETLLDGEELEELHKSTGRKVYHILFIDSYYTWWACGKSYLLRMVDMLHMGLVDEIIVGREIFERVPELVHFCVSKTSGEN